MLKKGCNEMRIKTIPRSEFDRLLPQNPALENLMVVEVEWFSNRSGNMLGTIAKGESVAGWNYAILKRGKKGGFYVHKVMNNCSSSNAARVDLLISMAEIAIDEPDLSVLCSSPAPSEFVDRTSQRSDVPLAV